MKSLFQNTRYFSHFRWYTYQTSTLIFFLQLQSNKADRWSLIETYFQLLLISFQLCRTKSFYWKLEYTDKQLNKKSSSSLKYFGNMNTYWLFNMEVKYHRYLLLLNIYMVITSIDHKWLLIHEFDMTQRKGTNSALLINILQKYMELAIIFYWINKIWTSYSWNSI